MIFHIDGEKWKVRFLKEIIDEEFNVAGICYFDKKTLYIATDYSKDLSEKDLIFKISETYYHEILHGIFHVNSFRDFEHWTPDFEHVVIAPIARSLAKNLPLNIKLPRKEK